VKKGNLNAPTDQSQLYKVHKDAAFEGYSNAPWFKPLLFPVRLPKNCKLNFLGRPEVGITRFMQYVGSHLPNSTESHRKNPLFPSLIILNTLFCLGDRGSSVVKVLCYKSECRWFDPSWCQWSSH